MGEVKPKRKRSRKELRGMFVSLREEAEIRADDFTRALEENGYFEDEDECPVCHELLNSASFCEECEDEDVDPDDF